MNKTNISYKELSINGETEYVQHPYDSSIFFMPNANYNICMQQYIKGYKILKCSSNIKQIKRVFLIGYSHLAIKQAIYQSAYKWYETNENDKEKSYEIDENVYLKMNNDKKLNKFIEKFEFNSFYSTNFVEENGSIIEKQEEISESIEDNESTFDIHLVFLKYCNLLNVKIVPIWVNLNCSNYQELLNDLGEFLSGYNKGENKGENIFIFTGALTYFGRHYNYCGDPSLEISKEFNSRMFLRDIKNEPKVKEHIESMDNEGLSFLKLKDIDGLTKLTNFNYVRGLMILLVHLIEKSNIKNSISEDLEYSIRRYERIDESCELNMVSYISIAYVNLNN